MAQLSMKCGLQKSGPTAKKATTKEPSKLQNRNAFSPVRIEDMTEEHKAMALELLIFLKDKRDRTIKGCEVAERRKQRKTTKPKYTTSPTVSTEAVLLPVVIDALEECEVAIVDITGAYLSVNMDDEVYIQFQGTLAELMLSGEPALYRLFVLHKDGMARLYVQL